ncbi:MAG: hypothetical protein ACI3W7_05985, partial [Oscillospiraceae bacterium]
GIMPTKSSVIFFIFNPPYEMFVAQISQFSLFHQPNISEEYEYVHYPYKEAPEEVWASSGARNTV